MSELRLLGLDIETTGLDSKTNRILEIGISLHKAGDPIYLHQNTWTLYDEGIKQRLPLTEEIKSLTGISDEALSEFGVHPTTAYRELDQYLSERRVDFIVAHNGRSFDRPFILHELDELKIEAPFLRKIHWLDTRYDLPHEGVKPKQNSLEHLLMLKRMIPAISHRALSDALHTMWLLSHYPIEKVLENSEIPNHVVKIFVTYEDREIAKKNGYAWEKINGKTYEKSWVKMLRSPEIRLEQEKFPRHTIKILE